jgi:hypothetical protein
MYVSHQYNEFTEKKLRKDVNRVYKTASSYIITSQDIITDEGKTIKFSEAGVDYKSWLDGEEPKPIKELHCPLEHYGQGSAKGEEFKGFGPCRDYLALGGFISKCSVQHREECWKTFEEEFDE